MASPEDVSDEPLRIVLVGCGDIARTGHLPALHANPDVQLVGVVDPVAAHRESVAAEFGVPHAATVDVDPVSGVLTSWAHWRPDAAIVATPPEHTPVVTARLVRAGLNILCEKPMAVDVPGAEALVHAVESSPKIVQVGFVNRFSPVIERVKTWIDAGELGRPLAFLLSAFDEVYDATDEVHTNRILHFLGEAPAFFHEAAHHTDYVAHLGGGRPTRVVSGSLTSDARFPSANYTCGVIDYDNGDRARLEVGWMFPSLPKGDFRVFGPRASAYVRRSEGVGFLERGGERLDEIRLNRPWDDAAFDGQLDAFVRGIRSSHRLGPGVHDGLASLRLCQAVVDGRWETS